ncbi:BglG family transcription antiterminator [Niallia nealsonii]|uniref:Ascorbate-specific PTS system EIIA component n=1 Tax=Niallia nealsonii TaxID=115979 RepID=A0A2N0YXT2_9BACI|nr:BglG family transcription antiterminator [Niallia nealsonii]PKG22062.1 PTS sugar transporter subunit IIA [Niallia nealsonii]
MYLDERSNTLLKEVIVNPNTSNIKLEKKFNLSRRQVSYSFQKINDWLEGNNYPPIKKTNSGKFIISPVVMKIFAEKVDENRHNQYIPSEKERAQLIILLIINNDNDLSLFHFTSALKVSKNTILRDLKTVQKIIEPYHLAISYSRSNGYELAGKEWNIRKLAIDVLQNMLSMYHAEAHILDCLNVRSEEIQAVKKQMEEIETKLELQFIDESFRLLPFIMVIILKRMKQGKFIKEQHSLDYEALAETKEYLAAEVLVNEIDNIPKLERLFITLQLLTSKILTSHLSDKESLQLKESIAQTLEIFENKACIKMKEKEVLLNKLMLHMKPAYYRIKYHLTTNYPTLEKSSEELEEIHFIVKDSVGPLENYIGGEIEENELMFLTILIGGHLLSSGDTIQKKMKAVVVCPNGVSISKLMESTLRDLFPEFYFYHALSIREFQKLKFDFDLIFSPVPLQTEKKLFIVESIISDIEKMQLRQRVLNEILGLTTNIINIDQLMNTIQKYAVIKEKQRLTNALQEHFSLSHANQDNIVETRGNLSLATILTPDMMVVKRKVASWEDGLKIAAAPLLQSGAITENYVEEMIRQYPTMLPHIVLRNVIALPHAGPDCGVNKIGMSLLKIEEGLPFNEGERVCFIVVLAATDKNKHLQALRQLINLSKNLEEIEQLKAKNNLNDLYEVIKKYS